jgi:hypothetical protein
MHKQNTIKIAGIAGIQIIVIAFYVMLLYFVTVMPDISVEMPRGKEFSKGTVLLKVKNNNWFSYKFKNVQIKVLLNDDVIGSSDIGDVVVSRNSVSTIKAEVSSNITLQNGIDLLLGGISGKSAEVQIVAEGKSVWFGIHAELFNKKIPLDFL